MKKQLDLAKKNRQADSIKSEETAVTIKRTESGAPQQEVTPTQDPVKPVELHKMPAPSKPSQSGSKAVTFVLIGIILLMILFIYYLFFLST